MLIAASPLIQNLLLEDPWPLGLTFIVLALTFAFLGLQRGNPKQLRIAAGMGLLAAIVFVLAALITTRAEAVIQSTQRLLNYTAPLQLSEFKAMVDPKVVLFLEESTGGEGQSFAGEDVFQRLERTVQGQPVEAQTILEIDVEVKGEFATCTFDVRTNVRGGLFITRWVLTWQRQADDTWKVTEVRWVRCPRPFAVQPASGWIR